MSYKRDRKQSQVRILLCVIGFEIINEYQRGVVIETNYNFTTCEISKGDLLTIPIL